MSDNRKWLADAKASVGTPGEQDALLGLVGKGYAVRLDSTNVVKGIVTEVRCPDSDESRFTVRLNDSKQWHPGGSMYAGYIMSVPVDVLHPTRKAALESRPDTCKRKAKARKPDKLGWTRAEHMALHELLAMPCPIRSLLENDLYKFSMAQFMLHRYPRCVIRVQFRNRGPEKLGYLAKVIEKWLDELCMLRYQPDEIAWLSRIDWLTSDFIGFLRRFYLFRDQIHVEVSEDGELDIWTEAPFIDNTWFEVMCLALVAEARATFKLLLLDPSERGARIAAAKARVLERADMLSALYRTHPFTLSEFGLRRRASAELEEEVVKVFSDKGRGTWFAGTSNMYLARKYGVKPAGTMAHELYMAMQGVGIAMAHVQNAVWTQWMDEFNGRNGILLTDPFGAMACCKALTPHIAKSYDGFRHDSGNPIVWGDLMLTRLNRLGVNPADKTFVWSDALDFAKMQELAFRFSRRVKVAFGNGTWLVHDLDGIDPSNIVMKLTHSNGRPVLKVPDSPGKLVNVPQWLYDEAVRECGIEPLPGDWR